MEPTDYPPLPNFLIIGAQKSATRWLRVNLGLHPQVFTATGELDFFDHPGIMERKGIDWYRSQFDGWSGEPFVGESTPGYMMWRRDPKRMAEEIDRTLPDVRLLAVLRNPVDRAQSALVHHMKYKRVPKDSDLLTMVRRMHPGVDPLGIISGGWYAASLRPYMRRFGERLLVQLHDDVKADPAAVYKAATAHIGADGGFLPEELTEVMFSNQSDTNRGRPDKLSKKKATKAPMDPEVRAELYQYFRRDLLQLERLIGRDLSMWAPDGTDG